MFQHTLLWLDAIVEIAAIVAADVVRNTNAFLLRQQIRVLGSTPPDQRTRNIVVVGASFAGYHAARIMARSLPRISHYRVVVIEPNSHFQFTWLLPRFCVAPGQEHKAFIPYGGYISDAAPGSSRWIRDWATDIGKNSVTVGNGDVIPYEYLVVATGSGVHQGLPSRVNATDKAEGMKLLREFQASIQNATRILIVGGGAAGVELATDAKSKYPDKNVALVHPRSAPMHLWARSLQKAALEGLERLGCELILNERVIAQDDKAGTITLESGKVMETDCVVNCTGQKPSSELMAKLSPNSIASTGHIKVNPNLSIRDDSLSDRVYICGDVADTQTPNPNARSAMLQGSVVADNVLLAIKGQKPRHIYKNHWLQGFIKLTLGLDRSTSLFGNGETALLFNSREEKEDLMAAQGWKHLGAKPFVDDPSSPKSC